MNKVKNSIYPEKTSAAYIDLKNIPEDSPLYELIEKLNCSLNLYVDEPKRSIMHFGQICDHDSAFLCECRLQFIVNFIKKNYVNAI